MRPGESQAAYSKLDLSASIYASLGSFSMTAAWDRESREWSMILILCHFTGFREVTNLHFLLVAFGIVTIS